MAHEKDAANEAFERFMLHMPVEGDLTLIVLKAHLLIEEQLWALISARLKLNDDLLARFKRRFQSSADIALLAEALVSDEDANVHEAEWVWKAIEYMNSLRNRLAHDLEPVGVSDKMSNFTKHVLRDKEGGDATMDFYFATFKVCHALSNLRAPVDWTDFNAF